MKLELKELTGYLNEALGEEHKVRLYPDHSARCTWVIVDGHIRAYVMEMVEPGYLNCTKEGTPSRVIAIEDRGLLGDKGGNVTDYRLCMSHRRGI